MPLVLKEMQQFFPLISRIITSTAHFYPVVTPDDATLNLLPGNVVPAQRFYSMQVWKLSNVAPTVQMYSNINLRLLLVSKITCCIHFNRSWFS